MPDAWIEHHIGAEAVIRPEFRNSLADDLQSQWQERGTVEVRPTTQSPRNRWRIAAWAAAAAALLVGLIVVLDQPSADSPPVDSSPSTSSAPPVSKTTTPSTSTSGPAPTSEADLVVPLTGGDVIRPTSIAIVTAGGGPSQLSGFNGEFPPLVAAFPGSLLVLDDVPFSGFTGRALSFDRTGQWDRDLTIDGIAGATPLWAGATPNRILFVAAIVDGGSIRVTAHRLVEDTFVVVDTATLDDLSETEFHITPDGLLVRDRQIIAIATGLGSPPPTATVTEPSSGVARAELSRRDNDAQWTVEMETEGKEPSDPIGDVVGVHNDGVWYSASVSSDPMVDQRFLALLDSGGSAWFRLAEWTVVASDDTQLVVGRATTGGFELAVLGTPSPDLSPDLLAGWQPAPTASDGFVAPMMLPSISMPDEARRLEHNIEDPYDRYFQYWVDIETGALLELQTQPASGYVAEGTVVSVAPWDHAIVPRMGGGYESLQLSDPSGTVQLWTDGLSRSDLLEFARSLKSRGPNPGWDIGNLPANIVPVHQGWAGAASSRTVWWSNAQLDIGIGDPVRFVWPRSYGDAVRLVDVEGVQAVFFDNGVWSAMSWSPAPGVTIVFAMYGTPAEVEAAARSIVEVDRSTWESASKDATGEGEGCQTSFFC